MTDRIVKDIEEAEGVGEETKRTLKSRLRKLEAQPEFPKDVIKAVEKASDVKSGRLALFHSVLSLVRKSDTFAKMVGENQRQKVLREAELLKDEETERRAKGEKRENDLEWKDVLKCEEKVPKNTEDYLVYLLYTSIPPVRADFTPCLIVQNESDADDPDFNYYVRKGRFVLLNVYKTASKYGQQRLDVPKKLADAIPTNQEWLFQVGDDPITPNALAKKVSRVFKRYCGVNVTINTLRRAYAAHTMTLSKEEQIEAAMKLGHSLSVHREYARRGKPKSKDE